MFWGIGAIMAILFYYIPALIIEHIKKNNIKIKLGPNFYIALVILLILNAMMK